MNTENMYCQNKELYESIHGEGSYPSGLTESTSESTLPRCKARLSKKRKSIIIGQLCLLSRNGWSNAKPYDYEPLEAELRKALPVSQSAI